MLNSVSSDNLKNRFELKIQQGCELLSSLDGLKNLSGITKVKKKIRQELAFLKKMLTYQSLKNEHLLSTNLHHFDALVSCIFNSNDVVSVLETKSYRDELNCNSNKKLCIDVICEGGRKWIKVIARNPKALSQVLSGRGDYGQKSILDHAVQYKSCADQNHFMFEPPQVCFFFASGLTTTLVNSLKRVNVCAIGTEIHEDSSEEESELLFNDDDHFYSDTDSDSIGLIDEVNTTTGTESKISNNLVSKRQDISTINLDVSTMIAYVSALTNGGCNWTFKEPLLNQQAEWERARPVKPILDDIFHGKNLICCETAWKSFNEIVDIIGGSSEKLRTKAMMSIVKVVPDIKYNGLKLGGKIKPRSVIIFGTGYHHKAVTVTANEGFIRAAKHQNSDFAVVIHESRALTEIKQENCVQL